MSAAIALPRRAPPDPRLLQRSLLLAALLHVWLVLFFGNAIGTAAPGRGVWGSLTVQLLSRSGGTTTMPPGEPVREWRDNGAHGKGPQPRQGGRVRPAAPAAADPGAAELGRWNPRDVAPEAARTDEASAAPPSTATLDLPEGFKPIAREPLAAPAHHRVAMPAPAIELPAAIGRLEARPSTDLVPLPPTASLRTLPRPAALPPPPGELPAPVSRLEAAPPPARAAMLPRAAELRAAPPAAALSVGTALPATVQRLEAPGAEGGVVAPLSRPSGLRAPAAPPLPSGQDLPAPVQRLESTDGGVAPLQPAPQQRAVPGASAPPELSDALPGQVAMPAGPAGLAKGDPAADPFAAPKAAAGSPDAGPRLGPDLALPPSSAASAPRAPLNLSLPRGGDIAARRGPGLVDLLPQPPERKSRLEHSIENAANQDCRKAYANTGLLAALPLAVDAARGKGCKW
ncbi:hypothetical protein [Roseateles sp.]|uniref:hypothetical protein n=1 Tax=Roseateles sp. TaxID=1971397 RepID=UPI0025E87435|nr:hypothetical protein [Roseateles sp.]MBV8034279.1 hypothetical protein [Roseateles sp.]